MSPGLCSLSSNRPLWLHSLTEQWQSFVTGWGRVLLPRERLQAMTRDGRKQSPHCSTPNLQPKCSDPGSSLTSKHSVQKSWKLALPYCPRFRTDSISSNAANHHCAYKNVTALTLMQGIYVCNGNNGIPIADCSDYVTSASEYGLTLHQLPHLAWSLSFFLMVTILSIHYLLFLPSTLL